MKKYSAIIAILLAITAIGCAQNGSESVPLVTDAE